MEQHVVCYSVAQSKKRLSQDPEARANVAVRKSQTRSKVQRATIQNENPDPAARLGMACSKELA